MDSRATPLIPSAPGDGPEVLGRVSRTSSGASAPPAITALRLERHSASILLTVLQVVSAAGEGLSLGLHDASDVRRNTGYLTRLH